MNGTSHRSPTPDARAEAMRKSAVRRKKRRRRRLIGWLVFFLIVAVGVAAVLSLTVLFPVKEIVATGQSRYTAEQIVAASGIREKDNLLRAGLDAPEKIQAALPYIGTVTVKRELSGRVILEVQDTTATACYQSGEAFILTDAEHRVLEITDHAPSGVLFVRLAGAVEAELGKTLTFSDDAEKDLLEELLDATTGIGLSVNALDLSDPLDITLTVEGKYRARFGSKAYLEKKLELLVETIAALDPNRQVEIDLSSWAPDRTQAYVRDAVISSAPESSANESSNASASSDAGQPNSSGSSNFNSANETSGQSSSEM